MCNDLVQRWWYGGAAAAGTDQGRTVPRFVIDSQHTRPLFDVLGICRLQLMELGFEVENYEELFSFHITGKKAHVERDAGRVRADMESDTIHLRPRD
jgi:aldehyde:ferredoxin oxidoreductase